MPAPAPGKFTSEFWLTATTQAAATAALFDASIPFGRAVAGMAILTLPPVAYTACRTWIKKHGGPDLPDLCGTDPTTTPGPRADPLAGGRPPATSTAHTAPLPPTVTLKDKR